MSPQQLVNRVSSVADLYQRHLDGGQRSPQAVQNLVLVAFDVDLEVFGYQAMLTAESVQPGTGDANRVGGFSQHLVRGASRNVREIQDTVMVAGRHAMSHDVL